MDSHVGKSGAVAGFSDMMLEAEPHTAIQRAYFMIMNFVSNETRDTKARINTDNLAGGPQIKASRDGEM